MAHLFTGSALLLTAIILVLIDRYYPYVDFMSSFSAKGFKRLVSGLAVAGLLLLSFGVYSYMTYQPPFLKISIDGDSYYVEGEMGKVGYIQKETELYRASEMSNLRIVLWKEVDEGDITIHVADEGAIHSSELKRVEDSFASKVVNKLEATALYQLPITFTNEGEWKVTVKEAGKVIGHFYITVSP